MSPLKNFSSRNLVFWALAIASNCLFGLKATAPCRGIFNAAARFAVCAVSLPLFVLFTFGFGNFCAKGRYLCLFFGLLEFEFMLSTAIRFEKTITKRAASEQA